MIQLVRIELEKLRTVRLTYGLLATAVGLSGLFSLLTASRAGGKAIAPLYSASGLNSVTTTTGIAMLLAAVLGVAVSAGEFRHSTATVTYLATPDRNRVLLAKALAAAPVGAVFGLVAASVSTVVGLAYVGASGDPVALSWGTLAGHVGGAALAAGLLAAVGVGIGSLVRNQIGANVGVIAWSVVIESLVGGLFTSARPYLPYTAANTLAGIKFGGAGFGMRAAASGPGPLPFVAAAALVAGVAVVVSALAARTTVQRDIA